jgi:hypothetical protein
MLRTAITIVITSVFTANAFAVVSWRGPANTSASVGDASAMNQACKDSYSDYYVRWATTRDWDQMMYKSQTKAPTDLVALRSTDFTYRANGLAVENITGAVSKRASDFPGAVRWKSHSITFAPARGTKAVPLCVVGSHDPNYNSVK